MKRETPVRHNVSGYTRRDGTRVGTYSRGKGTKPTRKKRVVGHIKAVDRLDSLAGDVEIARLWGIDTEYCHGIEGLISFSPGISGGRIGPDLDFEGTLVELLEATKPGGKIHRFLKVNDYQTKITSIETINLDSAEERYLDLYSKVHNIET